MTPKNAKHDKRPSTWTWPIALGAITIFGLLSALLSDGVWDALSWVALGIPVAVCLWFGWLRRTPRHAG